MTRNSRLQDTAVEKAEKYKNILLIQLGDIGDVVLTTPTIRAAKETYPEARVSILVLKPFGSLLWGDPNLHEIVETSRVRGHLIHILREYFGLVRHLRRAHYDLAIDLRTGDRGAILCFFTGARTRIGRDVHEKRFWRNLIFTRVLHDTPAAPLPVHPGADQSLRIVRLLGIDTVDSIPRLYVTTADRVRVSELLDRVHTVPKNFITVNPFSRWAYKEWSNEKWGKVIDRIWETRQIPTVLIGSPQEAAACQAIVTGREGRTINMAGKTSLGELAALISVSSLHLGVDSAAPHIAYALGTPTVTIHGPSDWRAWRIIDDLHKVIIPNMECVPCNRRGCNDSGTSQCLELLDVDAVIEVIEQVIQKSN